MNNDVSNKAQNDPEAQNDPLFLIIDSLEKENSCPPDVLTRLKKYTDKPDATIKDLPPDLRWIVSIVLERNDALIQYTAKKTSEQKMFDQLVKVQQEKERAQALLVETVEAGNQLSVICDKLSEDYKGEASAHYSSNSEKSSNLSEDPDEAVNPTADCKESRTQEKARESLGNYFRNKQQKIDDIREAMEKKGGHKNKKNQQITAEATGAELIKHWGEEELPDPTYDGYEDLSKLVETLCASTPVASDGVKVTWARCKPGHRDAVVANVEEREVFYSIDGKALPVGNYPPQEMEINGQRFKLVGYEAVSEIKMKPATAFWEKHLYPKYKVSLKDLGTEDRAQAIVRLQELLGSDVYVDGFKSAFETVTTRGMQDPFPDEEVATDDGDDKIPDDLITEDIDMDSEGEALKRSDENGEAVTSPSPSEKELADTDGRSTQPARRQCPEKISRRTENKERNQRKQQQADSAMDGEEGSQEDARRKEELAQKKRECERQRHELKKQEKMEKKKAENPKYKPSGKRSKQRMETIVHPASDKKHTPLISGKSYWSPSLVAYILFLTLSMMLPVYRLECASATMLGGLNIPLSTMEALSILVFERKLKYLLPYFYEVMKKVGYMQADETTVETFLEELRKNTTKSYIWIYSTIVSCPTQVRIYDYEPGRKGEFCKTVLASFVGVLITDAYQGYNLVENVQHAFCFIHARRKIYDAAKNGSSRYARKLARHALVLIDKLFEIERELQAAGYDPVTLAIERQKRMSGILTVLKDTFIRMQKDQRITPNGKLAKAANYMLNHYDELTYFLKDGNVPMHNQVSEHAARRVALYRNNSMFCGSPRGAKAFAGILTVAETARANNLDVYKYFLFLLENMRGNDFWKDEELMRSLLPWSERAQAECAARNPVKQQKIRLLGGETAV